MKKHYDILFLAMSCNDPFFEMSRKVTMDTWAKGIIEEQYPGVGFYAFTCAADYKERIENNCIYVNVEDDYRHTYSKTVRAMQMLHEQGITWDVLIRTNTSIYFNVERTVQLVKTLDKNKLYSYLLGNLQIGEHSVPLCVGWVMIMPKLLTDLMIMNAQCFNEEHELIRRLKEEPNFYANDDVLIGIFRWILCNNKYDVELKLLPNAYIKHYKTNLHNRFLQAPLPDLFTRPDQYTDNPDDILQLPWVQVRLFGVEHQYRYIELEHMYELHEAYNKKGDHH